MRARPSILAALAAVTIAVVAGCGGTVSGPVPTASTAVVSPSPDATATAAPTPAASPTTAPPTTAPTPAGPFESAVYPYTLELPTGVRTRNWTAAVAAWDGEARFGTDSRAVDITGTVDGTLMIFGLAWDGDLAGFMDLVTDSAARFHGCSATGDTQAFEANGVAGLGEQELCANSTPALNLVLLKDGQALAVRVMVNADKVGTVFETVVGWLDGLTWVTP